MNDRNWAARLQLGGWATFWSYVVGVFGVQLVISLLAFILAPIIGMPAASANLPVLLRRMLTFMLSPPFILGALGVGVIAMVLPRSTLVQRPWFSSFILALTFAFVVAAGDVFMDILARRPVAGPIRMALLEMTCILGVGYLLKWTIKERNL